MLVDLVPVAALLALLATAYLHPRPLVEAAVAVVAGTAVLATGTLGTADLQRERDHLVPVVLFLVAVLVVAECCRAAGLFTAIGSRLAASGSPQRIFALTFVVAAAVTVVLSLDATVVLLTPVAIAAAAGAGLSARPLQLVCVRLANIASLLLPVSNLTNLLAVPDLDLSFGRFALLMAPVWVLALVVEYAVQRLWFRAELSAPATPAAAPPLPLPVVPVLVVAAMLAGFAASSVLDPAWSAGAAALVLAVRALLRGELTVTPLVRSAHLPFALFVLSLGLVVAALGEGPLGDRIADLVPDGGGLPALLAVALIGAVLANLVNNLPATLLLVPLVAPLGAVPVLATLIGVNLGSSMTWSGSLANLLWRRTVQHSGGTVSTRDFHLVGLLATPLAVVGGVLVLHGWSGWV
ncbi:arsenical pump membrane protein [Marmoricola sp. OAE513]|uniref:SLC13 family permease n=1 Tax=Marmoricola sp. OAE513 TaxID=2817894 RepID=UPI001AE23D53